MGDSHSLGYSISDPDGYTNSDRDSNCRERIWTCTLQAGCHSVADTP